MATQIAELLSIETRFNRRRCLPPGRWTRRNMQRGDNSTRLPSKPVTTPASLGTMVERAEHPAFVAIFKLLAVLVVGFFRAIRLGDADKIAG
jgi:hypothetical protein